MGRLTNAIKALFSKNTTNAASASGARVPIVDVSGDPIGNASMADLASVLGAVACKIIWDEDANNCKTTGVYYLASGCSNVPSNYFIMLVMGVGNDFVQIGVSVTASPRVYVRSSTNAWSEISIRNPK